MQSFHKEEHICAYPSMTMAQDLAIPELDFTWLDGLFRHPNAMPWDGALQPQLEVASASLE